MLRAINGLSHLAFETDVPGVEVIPPTTLYNGKTHSELVCDSVNWLFSVNPDENNLGPVVFLKPFPPLRTILEMTNVGTDANHETGGYEIIRNRPNVMVGDDMLEIFEDQAVLIPIIMAYWSASEPHETEVFLRQRVRTDIDNGDNPPRRDQVTINGTPVLRNQGDMAKLRIETPVFPLMIPDVEYGTSYKDYVEYPYTMEAGVQQAVVCGYYLLVKLTANKNPYVIHSYARGRKTEKGEYYAEFLYQIKVMPSEERAVSPKAGILPQVMYQRIEDILNDKLDKKKIAKTEAQKLLKVIKLSRELNRASIYLIRKQLIPDDNAEAMTKVEKLSKLGLGPEKASQLYISLIEEQNKLDEALENPNKLEELAKRAGVKIDLKPPKKTNSK